jgi:hypothetical protein
MEKSLFRLNWDRRTDEYTVGENAGKYWTGGRENTKQEERKQKLNIGMAEYVAIGQQNIGYTASKILDRFLERPIC